VSRPDLSVVAPCFNEEDNVARLAGRLAATFGRMGLLGETVLVDDGSADRTWERIQELQARPGSLVQGVRHDRNRGIEGGWTSGLRAARAPLACLIDADLQNRPEDVARLHARWQESGADLVQAVRQPTGADRYRLVYSRTLNAMLNATFGMRLRDSKSGFILGRREVLASLLEHRWRYRYYQVFLGVAAGVRGLAIAEVETPFEPRTAGKSFLAGVPLLPILRILAEMAKYRCETWMFRPERAASRFQGSAS
jgi:phenylacetate-CoA ligase